MTVDKEALDGALVEAISLLTLGISDALGPVRPVTGLSAADRRASKTLLRAMERAYVRLKAVDAQYAYDMIAEHSPAKAKNFEPFEEVGQETLEEFFDFQPSVSIRTVSGGLPTLGKG